MQLTGRLLVPLLVLLPSAADSASILGLGHVCAQNPPACGAPPPNSGFVSVATGNYHTMGLRLDGRIEAWGECDVEQCSVPLPNDGFIAISAGDSHSLALRADGSLAAWGSNESAQLDLPQPNSGYVAIAAGGLHNIALKADGSIVDWGYNLWGAPVVPQPNTAWVAIAAGGYYRIGLKADGSVRRWGCNGPCAVPTPNTGFVSVATHIDHSLAVKSDGSIVAWGSNEHGQLDVPAPNAGFVAVAAGDHFSLGLKSDGSIAAWGSYDQSTVPPPNRGYLQVTANKGLAYTLKSTLSDPLFSEAPQISSFAGQGITALAIDVEGDGDQDLVSSEYSSDSVVWYENNGGAPPIWTKRTIAGALGPQTVAAADFDGDGDVDVLSPNFNDDSFAWYENDGASPPAWTARIISFVPGPWAVHAADIDGDGDVDGIGGVRLDGPDDVGIQWFDNDGTSPPSFTVRRVSAGFIDAASVHAADVDGDGDNDILAVDVFDDTIYCYENDGGSPPVWTERIVTTTTDGPFTVFAADLDRDGDLDVLSASQDDDEIAWHENRGGSPPAWTPHTITNAAPGALAVYARDLDGDSDPDVVSGAWENEVAWYESDGGVPPSFTRRVLSNDCASQSVFAARLDPDADVDLLVSCSTTGQLRWYPNHANFAESDGDGVRDTLDCAPADGSAFAVPTEIENLRYESSSSLAWSTMTPRSGAGTVYDMLRGSIDELPVGSGAAESCAGPATVGTSFDETSLPLPGTGFYHLVRGRNACGAGTYGFSSAGIERTSDVCPDR